MSKYFRHKAVFCLNKKKKNLWRRPKASKTQSQWLRALSLFGGCSFVVAVVVVDSLFIAAPNFRGYEFDPCFFV